MTDVFISYKSEDRARVKPLVDALVAEGLTVWWDLQIEGGVAWREKIRQQLDTAACVLVVWSTYSVGPAGHFVQDEASRARRRGVYLPIALDEVEPPLGFGQDQVLRLVNWRGARNDDHFRDVVSAAKAVAAATPRPAPLARARRVRRQRPPALAVAIGGGLALALVSGLVWTRAPARLCDAAGLRCPSLLGQTVAAAPNSIAVLPLANLSGDPAQEYFSDGLSEEIISTLSRLGGLQVVGRTSSFRFKGAKDTSAEIGRKLGVTYLVDGSVRRDGIAVRVSAQLVDAKSGFERWSQTYDRDMKDIFAVQSGIAQAVAEALKVRLLGDDIAALSRGGTSSPAAYDSYLRGRRLIDTAASEDGYNDALAKFDAAIAADPKFAAAHALRARVLDVLANEYATPAELKPTFDSAMVSARRAVELAPDLADAQATLGQTLLNATLDFSRARPAYDRAIALGGGDADVLTRYGLFSCRAGDFGPGLTAARRATVLDPLNPRVFKSLGLALMAARQYPAAIDAMRRVLALSPGASGAHSTIADALLLQGQAAAARAEYALEPLSWEVQRGQAMVLRRLGDEPGAEAAFRALASRDNGVTAYQQAQVLAQWGQVDRAMVALQAAFDAGDSGVLWMSHDAMLDPVSGDPRFVRLLGRLGLRG